MLEGSWCWGSSHLSKGCQHPPQAGKGNGLFNEGIPCLWRTRQP